MNEHTRRPSIRARGARLVGRMQYAPTRVRSFGPTGPHQQINGPQAPTNQHQPGRKARMDVPPRPYSTASGTRPAQGFALGYDPAPLQGARVPGAARRAASTNQRAARPQQTNNSTGRLRTPANLAGYPKGCPAFFACTNLPLRPAITIRSYRYIPFNIFFDSTEKRTIFVANFHVRCR